MFFSAVTQKLSSVRINAKCSVFSNNNRRRWDVYVVYRLARPALLLERNQLNKELNTKRKRTQSLYVFVVIFCCYCTVKGMVGGKNKRWCKNTRHPKKRKKKTHSREAPACCRTRAQPKWLELKSAVSSLVLYPTLISNNSQQGRRDHYLKRINQ